MKARQHRDREPVELIARAGYGARGIVYILVGGFAALAAIELRARTAGTREALQSFVEWPLGPVWLVAVAAGLSGFVLWRLLQSLLDADHRGSKPADLLFRAGQGVSALIYAGLAWTAMNVLDGLDDIREAEAGPDPIQTVLDLPLGDSLLLVAAALTAGSAVGNLAKAISKRFGHELECSHRVRRWALPMGRVGYAARGLVLCGIAYLLVRIASHQASTQEDTLGSTLQGVERLPFGSPLLLATGLALAGFGLYGLVEARFRRIRVPEELS